MALQIAALTAAVRELLLEHRQCTATAIDKGKHATAAVTCVRVQSCYDLARQPHLLPLILSSSVAPVCFVERKMRQ